MIITSKPGRGEKVHVFLDGAYTITTTVDYWYKQNISNGSEISPEEFQTLREGIEQNRMYNKALDLISSRDYSVKELREKLVTKSLEKAKKRTYEVGEEDTADRYFERPDLNFLKEQAQEVCDRLLELHLLDDERYARNYAAELYRNKHLSSVAILSKLSLKGIDRNVASLVIEEMELDSKESIRYLLSTKFRTRDLSDDKQKRRTVAALERMGYSAGDIFSVINENF